ncbi:MAG: DUF11 domain-containing protein [Planctomycetes bacterium]|nr:DUF11 domain-containing protein [Planctomycetota bacterium]
MCPRVAFLILSVASFLHPRRAAADSVVPFPTGKGLHPLTLARIDPQGWPAGGGPGTDTAVRPGDILTLVTRCTGVPNGATRALGGWVTSYVPRNAEVVGVRFTDSSGGTVRPRRAGPAQDGAGPHGARAYPAPLENGSMAQLYADTGIFFSTDPRTARVPDGSGAGEQLLTTENGIELVPPPTGFGQIDDLFTTAGMSFAHNAWDALHARAFGAGGTLAVQDGAELRTFAHPGNGNTPFGYGSPVAGPDTFYAFELTEREPGVYEAAGKVGPWRRIRTEGSEIGTGAPVGASGPLSRRGTPTGLGWDLSPENPLPAYDPQDPGKPWTNAVRFAAGELVAGEELFAEISLRVLDTPLDPVSGLDGICSEASGGDASVFSAASGGKDSPWRYFLPAPACALLSFRFDLESDETLALPGDRVTFRSLVKNLSTAPQTNVVVTHEIDPSALVFFSVSEGGVLASSSVTWSLGTLAPGDEEVLEASYTAEGPGKLSLYRASLVSDQVPAPGLRAVQVLDTEALAVLALELTAVPDAVSAGQAVHYRAVVAGAGTGSAGFAACAAPGCGVTVRLPQGFTYPPGSAVLNGAGAPDPTVAGQELSFTGLPDILPGGSFTLELDAEVGAPPAGLHPSELRAWAKDLAFGRQFESALFDAAPVAVDLVRSDPPSIAGQTHEGDVEIRGTTSEGAGATIRVRVNGNSAGTATSGAEGAWTAAVPALFAGQELRATAQALGELESSRELPRPSSAPPTRWHAP